MSEDGELSDSPPSPNKNSANDAPDDDEEGFVIDRSFTADVVVVKDSGDSGDSEKDSDEKKTSGGPSEWQKKMRRRLLEEVDRTTLDEPAAKRRRTNLCFNCRGEHSIAQCPEPKNFQEIRKNKQEFMAQNQMMNSGGGGPGGGRISKIADEKDARFKPGRLSQNLREALGLGSDDIPEWVYRMRRMGFVGGYPPGYLRKSLKHEFETIKIFSEETTKKKKTSSEDVGEEEEEEDVRPSPKVQQNLVHFYMGFNRTYKALRDRDDRKFEVPPFDTFCGMLQEQVSKDHETNEKHRRRDARDRRAEIQKRRRREEEKSEDVREKKKKKEEDVVDNDEDDDDIIVIDTKKKSGLENGDSEGNSEDVRVVKTPEPMEEKEGEEEEEMDNSRLGESIHQLIGTPIISRRDASGVWLAPSTPTLEQFAVGIVPFEAKEEEKPRGIFKKIMSIFRGGKKDNGGGGGGGA